MNSIGLIKTMLDVPYLEKITSTIIGLPMFYKIEKQQQQYVVEKLEYAINKI